MAVMSHFTSQGHCSNDKMMHVDFRGQIVVFFFGEPCHECLKTPEKQKMQPFHINIRGEKHN